MLAGIRVLLFRSLITFLGCILYVAEVTYFDYIQETGYFANESANLSFAEQTKAE